MNSRRAAPSPGLQFPMTPSPRHGGCLEDGRWRMGDWGTIGPARGPRERPKTRHRYEADLTLREMAFSETEVALRTVVGEWCKEAIFPLKFDS